MDRHPTNSKALEAAKRGVAWVLAHKDSLRRKLSVVQALAGALFLAFAYLQGQTAVPLLLHGIRTQGNIVAYRQAQFRQTRTKAGEVSRTDTAFMPVVEYRVGDQIVRFQDWLGTSQRQALPYPVTLLYDDANPPRAMVDRPVWNWIPWAPAAAVGLLLVVAAIKSGLSGRRNGPDQDLHLPGWEGR
jgi:hypothetical protein